MAKKKKPRRPSRAFVQIALIFLALAGIAIGLYLTIVHLQAGDAFCDVNDTISCTDVVQSKYGKIFGIPTSWLGVLTYIVLLALTIMGRKPERGRVYSHAPVYIFLISVWCILYSIFLAGVSAFVLKQYCVNCIALYFVNIGLLLGGWLWSGDVEGGRWATLLDDAKDGVRELWVWVAISLMALLLAGSYAFFGCAKLALQGVDRAHLPPLMREMDMSDFPLKGSPDAPVIIVEFSEFKCPWCRKTYLVLKEGRASYGEKYCVYFVHYPLDRSCNEKLRRTAHPGACEGAYASRCAQKKGKFWEYVDILFEHQSETWNHDTLVGYAEQLGLNTDKFRECLVDPKTKAFIEKNTELGNSVPITHTPTLFMNGVESGHVSKGLDALLEQLQKALSPSE